MSEKNKREQTINPKTVARSTMFLAIPLTFFVTLTVTAVAMYFITINMIGNQRASVVSDMQIAQKVVSK